MVNIIIQATKTQLFINKKLHFVSKNIALNDVVNILFILFIFKKILFIQKWWSTRYIGEEESDKRVVDLLLVYLYY